MYSAHIQLYRPMCWVRVWSYSDTEFAFQFLFPKVAIEGPSQASRNVAEPSPTKLILLGIPIEIRDTIYGCVVTSEYPLEIRY